MDPVCRRCPNTRRRISRVWSTAPVKVSGVVDAIAAAPYELRHHGIGEANAGSKVIQIGVIEKTVLGIVVDDFPINRYSGCHTDRIEGVQIEICLLVMSGGWRHLEVVSEPEVQCQLLAR